MPTFFFHSDMAGAPTNTSAAGSTLEIIRSCLVTGFNLKSVVSASVASGVMTINYASPHGYENLVWLRLDGAAGGSIVQRVTTTAGASSLTIPAPGFADGAVAGTLSTRVAPADWQEAFTREDGVVAVFRSKVDGPGSTRFYYRVADALSGELAYVRGFESMSDANTGIGQFPTTAQVSYVSGLSINRSSSASPLQWCAAADARTCYFFLTNSAASNINSGFCFGDFAQYGAADLFNALLIGSANSSQSLSGSGANHYTPRVAAGTGTAATGSKIALFSSSGSLVFPSNIDGGMVFSRPVLVTQSSVPRGEWRGLMCCSHNPIAQATQQLFAVRTDVNGVAGRVLIAKDGFISNNFCVAFPIDEDWA